MAGRSSASACICCSLWLVSCILALALGLRGTGLIAGVLAPSPSPGGGQAPSLRRRRPPLVCGLPRTLGFTSGLARHARRNLNSFSDDRHPRATPRQPPVTWEGPPHFSAAAQRERGRRGIRRKRRRPAVASRGTAKPEHAVGACKMLVGCIDTHPHMQHKPCRSKQRAHGFARTVHVRERRGRSESAAVKGTGDW